MFRTKRPRPLGSTIIASSPRRCVGAHEKVLLLNVGSAKAPTRTKGTVALSTPWEEVEDEGEAAAPLSATTPPKKALLSKRQRALSKQTTYDGRKRPTFVAADNTKSLWEAEAFALTLPPPLAVPPASATAAWACASTRRAPTAPSVSSAAATAAASLSVNAGAAEGDANGDAEAAVPRKAAAGELPSDKAPAGGGVGSPAAPPPPASGEVGTASFRNSQWRKTVLLRCPATTCANTEASRPTLVKVPSAARVHSTAMKFSVRVPPETVGRPWSRTP